MKVFLVIIIIIGMGYFAYDAITNSAAVNQESSTQRAIRENNLEDEIGDTLPKGDQEALVEVTSGIDGFFAKVQAWIREWRIEINTYIDEHL
ncbi:hypothetical protein KC929_00675 [Patescibacteria group bacterium]|nr:hypothetical protein [Patescibacteria group bacterium]